MRTANSEDVLNWFLIIKQFNDHAPKITKDGVRNLFSGEITGW